MKKILLILLGFILIVILLVFLLLERKIKTITPVVQKKPTITPTPSKLMKWGVFAGGNVSDYTAFEKKVNESFGYIVSFVHWGNENDFPSSIANYAKNKGKTLVIFWEAVDYNNKDVNDPRFSYDTILSGKYDKYFKSFAGQCRSYGNEIILIPFEEVNGDWYPWSGTKNNNSAEKHILAYRLLKSYFKEVPNVKFGWTINSDSVPSDPQNSLGVYYPGGNYVDIVGVNGFNFNDPWMSFSQIFDQTLRDLEKYQKPIMIFSMASAEGNKKADWIKDAFGVQVNKYKNLVGWIWFNENKEKDWRIWSSESSLKAFIESLPTPTSSGSPR